MNIFIWGTRPSPWIWGDLHTRIIICEGAPPATPLQDYASMAITKTDTLTSTEAGGKWLLVDNSSPSLSPYKPCKSTPFLLTWSLYSPEVPAYRGVCFYIVIATVPIGFYCTNQEKPDLSLGVSQRHISIKGILGPAVRSIKHLPFPSWERKVRMVSLSFRDIRRFCGEIIMLSVMSTCPLETCSYKNPLAITGGQE